MRLPKLAIENHQFTIIIIALLVLSGIVAFMTMPRSEDPQITPPGGTVTIIYPGANPSDMEQLVLDPIEEALNELDDVKRIASTAGDGIAISGVEFMPGSDPDEKYSDFVQKINSVRSDLPENLRSIDLWKWSSTDVVILQLALVSNDAPYAVLEKKAERLKDEIEKVPGVKNSEIMGYPEQQVDIGLDLEKMAAYNISLDRVISAIKSSNAVIPGGNLEEGSKRFNVRTSGSYDNLEEIKNTVIGASGPKLLYIKDIADIDFGYENKKYITRFMGKTALFITATQKMGTNIYRVTDGIDEKIAKFEKTLPDNITLETVTDQRESVTHRLDNFFLNLLQGILLVGIVIFFAVGYRASTIVMLAIPFSILIGLEFLDVTGYGLQQISIAGFVVALGLLVDNAIVVTENIARFMDQGYDPDEAAAKGTSQIGWAITSATATTVLAFVPIIMMQEASGDFIRSLPTAVIYTLGASLLISLTLTPYLSGKFIRPAKRKNRLKNRLDSFIEGTYRNRLVKSIKKPWPVIVVVLLLFTGSLALFPLIGVTFFPKSERPQFLVNIELPEGATINNTLSVTEKVEAKLASTENVKSYASNIGKSNPRIFYNEMSNFESRNFAQIFVEMENFDPDELREAVADIRDTYKTFPGAEIRVKELEQGPPVEAPIAIRIIGENMDMLKKISADVEDIFENTPGVINIDNPLSSSKTDLKIKINRDKAGMLGIPVSDIDRAVRTAVSGTEVTDFRDEEGKEYKIIVKSKGNGEPDSKIFEKIFVPSVTGQFIPLLNVAEIEFEISPLKINHYNLDRNVIVTASTVTKEMVAGATESITEKLDGYNFPEGYGYAVAGEAKSRSESFGGMTQAVMIALIGIFGVLVLQFKSYTQPLIVFSAIPLAVIGSILALFLTGNSFSFTAFIGLTSLVGIVVNNSIILVDYTNQLMKEGNGIDEALRIAGETRFMPIILTTLTTIGGLLPLTLQGGDLWAPMGWTIIGGLAVSTFLTLIIVPVLYKLFTKAG